MSNGDANESYQLTYQVLDGKPVFLTITIGDAQAGGTALMLNGKDISTSDGKVHNMQIGKDGESLGLSILQISTSVKDINSSSNKTSVTIAMTGGAENFSKTYERELSDHKGIVMYSIVVLFIA